MTHLPKDEKYEIKTLDDLFNCPVNMIPELIGIISECLLERMNRIENSGKGVYCKNMHIELINDGEKKNTITINNEKPSKSNHPMFNNQKEEWLDPLQHH
jgi:hypothetical protein